LIKRCSLGAVFCLSVLKATRHRLTNTKRRRKLKRMRKRRRKGAPCEKRDIFNMRIK
jgi:hypothetical protein